MRQFVVAVLSTWMLIGAGIGAKEVWESKAFTAWSDAELKKFLADSPWAGKGSLTHTRPGGEARPIDDTVVVTWSSGRPVRQAVVRQSIGQNGTVTPDMEALLAQPQDFYVVTLKIQGASAGSATNVQAVVKETFLRRKGKADLGVVQAESHMLDKDGAIIQMPQRGGGRGAVPPGPDGPPAAGGGGGRGGGGFGGGGGGGGFGGGGGGGFGGGFGGGASTALVVFAFPKTEAITLEDKEVELVSRIGQYNLKKKFKLKDMVVDGELAI